MRRISQNFAHICGKLPKLEWQICGSSTFLANATQHTPVAVLACRGWIFAEELHSPVRVTSLALRLTCAGLASTTCYPYLGRDTHDEHMQARKGSSKVHTQVQTKCSVMGQGHLWSARYVGCAQHSAVLATSPLAWRFLGARGRA